MPYIDWSPEKNEWLKAEREVCFDDVVVALREGGLRDIIHHPNTSRYGHQQQIVVVIKQYVYLVPFVERGDVIFLKTVYPSRKATKRYLHT